MGWCSDRDLVTYSIYSDIAWDEYFGNKNLLKIAGDRYDEVSGWEFGTSLAHIPTIALDYLYEATITYSFGFFRSSIFCCAAVLDLELKRVLIEHFPNREKSIQGQTFGQSIGLLKRNCSEQLQQERILRLEWTNRVRNRASVHPSNMARLVSCYDDDTPLHSSQDKLRELFSSEQVEAIKKRFQDEEVDWLERLAYLFLVAALPKIGVWGNGEEITSGDTTPATADNTDFGSLTVGDTPVTHTFTISNTGSGALTAGNISLTGAGADDFSLSGLITPTLVAANTHTDFFITFSSTVTGSRVATVSVSSDDVDEAVYDFAVQGNGVSQTTAWTKVYLPVVLK